MLVKAIIPVLIGLILLSSPVLAQELFQYEVNVEIHTDLSTTYEEKFIFSEYLSNEFVFAIEGEPTNIDIETNKPDHIDCQITKKSLSSQIRCNVSETIRGTFNIFVKYSKTDQIIQISENKYQFKESIRSPASAKNMLVPWM